MDKSRCSLCVNWYLGECSCGCEEEKDGGKNCREFDRRDKYEVERGEDN